LKPWFQKQWPSRPRNRRRGTSNESELRGIPNYPSIPADNNTKNAEASEQEDLLPEDISSFETIELP
jgi:hypothetical protein